MRAKALLAIGATGMLRPALDELAEARERTIVVARRAAAAHAARAVPCPEVVTLDLDWQDPGAVSSIAPHLGEDLDLALLWIHSTANGFWSELMTLLVRRPCTVVQVLGNRGDPVELRRLVAELGPASGFRYLSVKLGAIQEGRRWRWLTHDEISAGAVTAARELRDMSVGDRPPDRGP